MKFSSYLTIGIVVIAFVSIQGWVLARTFITPRVFTAVEAIIAGETVEVRAPIQGTIGSVMVQEYQRVEEDQPLFTVTRIVTDPDTLAWRHDEAPILAVRPGIMTNIHAKSGLFVQADQKIATIVDNSPGTLRVHAVLLVSANDVTRVRPGMQASVKADFLNDGRPLEAVVASVDPLYNAQSQLLSVDLQLLQYPDGIETLPLGLPVGAWVEQERSIDDNPVIALYTWLFPRSTANN